MDGKSDKKDDRVTFISCDMRYGEHRDKITHQKDVRLKVKSPIILMVYLRI